MPELPEVETVRRGLEPSLLGHRITHAEARRPDLRWPLPERMAARLTGARVETLTRRSKYILAGLDTGETWLIHLGMSGRVTIIGAGAASDEGAAPGAFALEAPGAAPDGSGPHDHVVVETEAARIVYTDARRFGAMDLWPTDRLEEHKLLAGLGPEPLGNTFHADALAAAFGDSIVSAKAALLDQKRVAGLGNIYVCEALWRAGVDPRRPVGGLSRKRIARLAEAIPDVLREAIEAGGSSLRDYRHADGALGYFQHRFAVYGREGEPCPRDGCDGIVRRIVQSGRSTFFCPRCQR